MVSERDLIAEEHFEKLRELYFLVLSALQPLPDFSYSSASTRATHFFDKNDVSTKRPFLLSSIPRVQNFETLKREIASNAQTYMYQTEGKNSNGKRPHEATVCSSSKILTDTANFLPNGIPCPPSKSRKVKTSLHLQSQLECIEQDQNKFLQKRISDLDFVTVPENCPTLIHNSTSLGELYYLTQTFPLFKLLPGAHKALTTDNFELALLEGKIAVIYSRIEELKRQNKWALRQPLRYYDPFLYSKRNKKAKQLTWDALVREGKWMAADFKGIQQFKKLCCVKIAQAVREYWLHGNAVCIKTKPIEHLPTKLETAEIEETAKGDADISDEVLGKSIAESMNVVGVDSSIPSKEMETETMEEETETIPQSCAEKEFPPTIDPSKLELTGSPDEIFEFDMNMVVEAPQAPVSQAPFKSHININDLKKIDQSIIRNLPKFTAFDDDLTSLALSGILIEETSLIPTSRMLYSSKEESEWYKLVLRDSVAPSLLSEESGPPPYQKGLFGVQSHRKFNFLKPQKPPLVKNINLRSPTIWLPSDDQLLIHCVAEYCFNWDLISAHLETHAPTLKHYTSNIEKRTSWQCFERYIQLNDKFQFRDMKGPNAAAAQIWLEEAHNVQLTTKRRISPFGVGNEFIQRGHKRLRWGSMFEAMRKTMRRREIAAAKVANNCKATPDHQSSTTSSGSTIYAEGPTPKKLADNASTPQELSKLKHDRDKAIQEAYFQRQVSRSRLRSGLVQKRPELLDGSTASPAPVVPMAPNAIGPSRATMDAQRKMQQQRAAQTNASDPSRASRVGLQAGIHSGVGQLSHVALAQLQAKQILGNMKSGLPNLKGFTSEQMQKAIQLEKQRLMLQQNSQMSGSGSSSVLLNNSMLAGRKPLDPSIHQTSSPTMLGAGTTAAASPTAKQAALKARIQYSPAQFARIVSTIQEKNSTMSKEQAKNVALSYLANIQQQQQATRAAQGVSGVSSAQDALNSRQGQLAARKTGSPAKDADAQGVSPGERARMLLAQESNALKGSPSPYTRTSGSRTNSPVDKLQRSNHDDK